jgi:nucleotide-binding universal stress UspA family protein
MITIRHILCPVDFSEYSASAVSHAAALARWYEARLTLLHVVQTVGAMDLPPVPLEEEERRQLDARLRTLAPPAPGVNVEYVLREAPEVPAEILAYARQARADLLVVGSHGRSGFERLLLGSVTEKLLRRAACPVMVVPKGLGGAQPDAVPAFDRILCPVDFSEASLASLTLAMNLAQEASSALTIMHAIEIPPELSEYLPPPELDVDAIRAAAEAAALRRLRTLIPDSVRTYCSVETLVVEGAAYRQILKVAAERHVNLIVIGVHGRGALDLMVFGSNTARVTRAAACPVLVVREG